MPRRSAIIAAIIVLVYAAARIWRLTDSCLWFDEIFSIHAAGYGWTDLIPFIARDLIHPPLFYFVLKGWMLIFGDGLIAVRLLPVVVSILALYPFWMLCRELKLRPGTTVTAFGFLAVNGALIKYAQEVRMYSMLMLLSLLSIWLFSRFYFRGKSFWVLVIANVLLVNTHYFGWFVVLSEVAAIAAAQRIKILQTLLMLGVTVVGFVPWVIALFRFAEPGSSVSQNIGWIKPPGIAEVLGFGLDLVDPFYFQQSSVDSGANYVVAVPLTAVILAAIIVHLLRIKSDPNKERLLFLAILGSVPVMIAFVLSWLMPVSVWGSRHLIIVFAPAAIFTAISLAEARPKSVRNVLASGAGSLTVLAFAMQLFREQPRQIWCAWEGLAVEWSRQPETTVGPKRLYAFEDLTAYHYWFATRSNRSSEVVLVKGIEGIPNDPAYFLPRGFDGVHTTDLNGVSGDEIWISFRQPTKRESDAANHSSARIFESPVTNLENLGYTIADVKKLEYGRLTAYLIRMRKKPR